MSFYILKWELCLPVVVVCCIICLSTCYTISTNTRKGILHPVLKIYNQQQRASNSKESFVFKSTKYLRRSSWYLNSALSNEVDTISNQQQQTQHQQEQDETKTRRRLGSQELLMLPRQYGVRKDIVFPSMNHVSCTILNVTPSKDIILQAVQYVMEQHPLLYTYVTGDGEPTKRIDLFQMVRNQDNNDDEPYPLMFVSDNTKRYDASKDIVSFIQSDNIERSWQTSFQRDLDDGSWCNIATGPLWKLEIHTNYDKKNEPEIDSSCALLLSFNHAISDQSSANRIIDQILYTMNQIESGTFSTTGSTTQQQQEQQQQQQQKSIPYSLEESVLGIKQTFKDIKTDGVSIQTLQYVVGKAAEGLKNPVILPVSTAIESDTSNPLIGAMSIISGREAGGKDITNQQRKSNVQFRTINAATTSTLVLKCKQNGVSISNALTAAVAYTTSDFISQTATTDNQKRYYKILQSLDMRRFGAKLDTGETVACMAGSHDLLHGPINDFSCRMLRTNPSKDEIDNFWKLANESKQQTESFLYNSIGPKEAVRVFDFAMTISDLNNLVYLSSQSQDTKGRAYSAGITNAGIYDKQSSFITANDTNNNSSNKQMIQNQHGRYKVEQVFYATPHTQSGCLFPVSCLTVNGELQLAFNPVDPIISNEISSNFADAFVELLETISDVATTTGTTKGIQSQKQEQTDESTIFSKLPKNILSLAATIIGSIAVASHGNAWIQFFNSVLEMKANIADPADFSAALNFWIFFAAGHPLLPPVLWISDVLHGSPGPKIADIVPISFILGNIIAIGAITLSKEIRNAVNIAAFATFLTFIGAGLDSAGNMGDFNLALDDSYRGQIVKGCPAYDEVRQPSMNGFDLKNYQGFWYEHKFHDWTQFKEVYDTTLDIKLTSDGLGWIDDFAVKGPSPDSAPLSWDKSPVANGAHYFLFGRVDPKDPPGVLRESGFGVEFPNYIVDVLKDPKTGEYTEAIQFQCLERGGVRVFEGINFMSRNPEMTDTELTAMHKRAENAGMYPYGASPEQMHRVAHRSINDPPIDNNWQALWRAIGVDKLLELLTKAIEDGGR